MRISARNVLSATVKAVKAYAIIKASNVMIGVD